MSFLPNKTIRLQYSTIGIGAQILQFMSKEETVTSLWNKVRDLETINTYEKFISALVVLYALRAVDIKGNMIVKNEN